MHVSYSFQEQLSSSRLHGRILRVFQENSGWRKRFSSQECTEDSADSDAVESVEDCKGKNHRSRQTGEIEGCLNDFIVLFYNTGQIAREDICRDDWKHTVVGKADTEAHQ